MNQKTYRNGSLLPTPGEKFNFLTVVGRSVAQSDSKHQKWEFVCDCGAAKNIDPAGVVRGRIKSCGCKRGALIGAAQTKHANAQAGMATPEYVAWAGIIQRTTNPNCTGYKHYGKRGITVCGEWRRFENFLRDMGRKPSPKHSVDRIDNNRGYEPGNCRWATQKEQTLNRRVTVTLSFNGETHPILVWSEMLGVPYRRLLKRVKLGWDPESILTEPPKTMTWAERCKTFSPGV